MGWSTWLARKNDVSFGSPGWQRGLNADSEIAVSRTGKVLVSNASGPLLAADEHFTHQVVDTFARVGQSDRAWTEKVCAMAGAEDGSVQLVLGLGKYTNRGVMDGYAGISRGVEQWTVRSSRRLAPDPETTTIGPVRYEILETRSTRRIRFALDANDVSPISFEWTFQSGIPPFLEGRETHISRDRYRLDADVIRFHHSGTATGWFDIDGVTEEFESDWVSTRDRSWGVRYLVGTPLTDLVPSPAPPGSSAYVVWFPVSCTLEDGTPYGLHLYYQRFVGPGYERRTFEGSQEGADGRRTRFVDAHPDLRFDNETRRLEGGTITVTQRDGHERVLTITPVSDTGFHLKTGLYGGYDGHWHGEWRDDLHVEADHVASCTAAEILPRVGQHRQALVRVDDPEVGGVGYGDLQSIIIGAHPEIGLSGEGPP